MHCFPDGEITSVWLQGREGRDLFPPFLTLSWNLFSVSVLRSMNINKWGKAEVELFHLEKDQWYVKWFSVHLILPKWGCQLFVSLTCLSILHRQGGIPECRAQVRETKSIYLSFPSFWVFGQNIIKCQHLPKLTCSSLTVNGGNKPQDCMILGLYLATNI